MKAYAIKHPDGKILRRSIRGFKKDSIKTVTRIFFEWKFQYRLGYRCVPVEITEIKPKSLSGEPLKALHKAIKASEKKSTELKDRK